MRSFFFLLCLALIPFSAFSQNSFHNKGDIFDDSIIHRIEVSIDTGDFNDIMSHPDSTLVKAADVIITTVGRSDSLQKVGFRIKGHASRNNPKKSYKISFNEYVKGEKYLGFKKLSVNAYWNDPTHLRAHLTTELFHEMGIPVARSSFGELFINGEYQGLYNLVEHIDDTFLKERFGSKKGNLYKCISPADLAYLGDDPEIYRALNNGGGPVYELKTNKKEQDYSGLAELISILNNTPIEHLEFELEKRFNVYPYLVTMAIDVIIGNWDSQLFSANNFYLYDNPLTGKFEFIPYDFDNTFGMDWVGIDWGEQDIYDWNHHWILDLSEEELSEFSEKQQRGIEEGITFLNERKRPLYNRMLEVESYRKYYEDRLRYIIVNYFDTDDFRSEIDSHFAMIAPALKADPKDDFDWEQIQQSLDHSLDVFVDFRDRKVYYLPYGLKEFITVSSENILNQLDP